MPRLPHQFASAAARPTVPGINPHTHQGHTRIRPTSASGRPRAHRHRNLLDRAGAQHPHSASWSRRPREATCCPRSRRPRVASRPPPAPHLPASPRMFCRPPRRQPHHDEAGRRFPRPTDRIRQPDRLQCHPQPTARHMAIPQQRIHRTFHRVRRNHQHSPPRSRASKSPKADPACPAPGRLPRARPERASSTISRSIRPPAMLCHSGPFRCTTPSRAVTPPAPSLPSASANPPTGASARSIEGPATPRPEARRHSCPYLARPALPALRPRPAAPPDSRPPPSAPAPRQRSPRRATPCRSARPLTGPYADHRSPLPGTPHPRNCPSPASITAGPTCATRAALTIGRMTGATDHSPIDRAHPKAGRPPPSFPRKRDPLRVQHLPRPLPPRSTAPASLFVSLLFISSSQIVPK